MGVSRYQINKNIPQPKRKIKFADTDIIHPFKLGERIDNLSEKYYGVNTEGWVIMCGNPEYDNEFAIPHGVDIRIPYPLQRVFDAWQISNEI